LDNPIRHIRKPIATTAQLLTIIMVCCLVEAYAVTKTAISSGNFSSPTSWSPSGLPAAGDIVIIPNGKTITTDISFTAHKIQIQTGGRLNVENNKTITITGEVIVDGTMHVYEGDVVCPNTGTPVNLGAQGLLVWEPANKTATGATLFTNGIENLHPTSTLVINHWYNYSNTPLGSVITGSFGNLTISTLYNGMLFEWDQKNSFAVHPVLGTLTIDQGWVVLDKTGQLSQLNIGGIRLLNENSHLDIHSGVHTGNISLTAGSFENNGGTFNGVLNGTANFNMRITGNFQNKGDFRLLFNNGQSAVNSGNASLKVDGTFKHIEGDFRGLFNISSMQAGTVSIETGEAEIDGGVFIAHYAMHRSNGAVSMKTNGKLHIKANDANDLFRVAGLTSIGTNHCTIGSDWIINGELEINGHINSEITSSVSGGPEQVTVNGKTIIANGKTQFNMGSHPTILRFNGDMEVRGGNTYFSKSSGALDGIISGQLILNSGTVNIRGGNGTGLFQIQGSYTQSGGELNLFNNLSEAAIQTVSMAVNGTFAMIGGKFRFNTNPLSAASHELQLNGSNINFGSGGTITTETYANNPTYGTLVFGRTGITEVRFIDPAFVIQNTRQVIAAGATVALKQGKFICSSQNTPFMDALVVQGTLDLNDFRIGSNKKALHSGFTVADGGRLRIAHRDGLYGSSTYTAIDMQGNFQYALDRNSIVEYCGDNNQNISGIGEGTANNLQHKYGILEINKENGNAKLALSNVYVRNRLHLEEGFLELNQNNIQLETSGAGNAPITHNRGGIISESTSLSNQGQVVIKNIGQSTIEIPFASNNKQIHLFQFEAMTGSGDFMVSTVGTGAGNSPMPSGVSNLQLGSESNGASLMSDRWYYVKADGIAANMVLGYALEESPSNPDFQQANTSVMRWNGQSWNTVGMHVNQAGPAAGASAVNQFGYMVAALDPQRHVAGVLEFNGALKNNQVELQWTSRPNRMVEKYIAERSTDGVQFSMIMERTAVTDINNITLYSGTDTNPLIGKSYYRIREIGTDGIPRFTNKITIDNTVAGSSLLIGSVYPTTFNHEVDISFTSDGADEVTVSLISRDGKIVRTQKLQSASGENSIKLESLEGVASGVYFIRIQNGKSSDTRKIMKISSSL
jgi:hypothetical protein